MFRFLSILLLAGAILPSIDASAAQPAAGALKVERAVARATVPGQDSAGAYLSLRNDSARADRLIGASSPVAGAVEMHRMTMNGNVMAMREMSAIAIPPREAIVMAPGDGYHLMLTGLRKPLQQGERFPMTLRFEKAGAIEVTVTAERSIAAGGAQHVHGH